MSSWDFVYEALWQTARPLARGAALFHPKLARAVTGISDASDQLRQWAKRSRDLSRKLVWVHAPSVGEGLMAQAIIGRLRELQPNLQIVFTHFSPSAEGMRDRVGADFATYLPPDLNGPMKTALDALQPSAVAFVRTEIWPTMARLAGGRLARIVLVNAVLSEESGRLRAPARALLSPAYRELDGVGAINRATAERFQRLGVRSERIRVTGDARFDQVAARVAALDRNQPLLRQLGSLKGLKIVAGSTWAADEGVVLPAFAQLEAREPARLILAPHEPNASHIARTRRACELLGLKSVTLTELEKQRSDTWEVLLIDRVGILADLYAIADIAFVGGAFHSAGVHSVVEPAALGIPVVLGPRHRNAAEAQELIDCGGGTDVKNDQDLFMLLERWRDAAVRARVGAAAVAFVRARQGAANANAELIEGLIG